MTKRFHLSFALCLLTAAALPAALAGSAAPTPDRANRPLPHMAARVDVLVGGVARPQYPASDQWYIEALEGRDYEIRITNPYPVRVAVALSVDGMNTIDARHTTAADGRKWVLGPHETITLSGWQVSLSEARRFHFTTEARSYGQSLGTTENLGVISAVFFRERARRPQPATMDSAAVPESSRAGASSSGASGGAQGEARGERDGAAARPAPKSAPAREADEYAATGIGRPTDHSVQQVSIDLDDTPSASVSIRYEFRRHLVRLGVLPAAQPDDEPLARRQQSKGFAPGFCPEPKR